MQNYFHVKKRTKTTPKVLTLLLSGVLLLGAAGGVGTDIYKSAAEISTDAKFLQKAGSTDGNAQSSGAVGTSERQVEMNNENDKNSKIYAAGAKSPSLEKVDDSILVLMKDGSVKNMELEEYVLCCVLGEMPSSFHSQALMAQSVAARTYAVRSKAGSASKHKNADVCTDFNCCQSYIAKSVRKISDQGFEKIKNAVCATRGVIAVYDGVPITAVYHASSGRSTLSSKEVWGGDLPYLVSVKAPESESEISKEQKHFTYSQLSSLLYNGTGKAVSCGAFGEKIQGKDGDVLVVDGVSFSDRDIANALDLSSRDFEIEKQDDGVTVSTYGYGHRVGMSQHGANILAGNGYGYADILKYYYNGISLSFV